eukprot:TRINITY_DN254_c0_g1_i1.p1 TRINITY_DN254_c0_g1~~TRINITY_DN254_c0_g1_i1.p1  ORF type:complete len:251 (-),score=15.98 TRINITY_DN254_c0_g1_i1:53-805(-)
MWVLFLGCVLVAFGPAFALFILFISKSGQLIVLSIGSSFFWLLSIVCSSIVWIVFAPVRKYYPFIIPFSVILQEGMRFIFYKIYMKAGERGFTEGVSEKLGLQQSRSLDYFSSALAIGFGFGLTHAVIMYGSVLVWATEGAGTLVTLACPQISLFLLAAIFALAFMTMHVFFSVISFDAFKESKWKNFVLKSGGMVIGHLVLSFLTLLNQQGGNCYASIILVYLVLAVIGVFAAKIAMSSRHLLRKTALD